MPSAASIVTIDPRLEALPPELILMVFEESKNPALAFTTKRLNEIITEGTLGKNLLIKWCLKNYSLLRPEPNFAHKCLWYLLQEPWLTFGWIWEYLLDAGLGWLERYFDDYVDRFGLSAGLRAEMWTWMIEVFTGDFMLQRCIIDRGIWRSRIMPNGDRVNIGHIDVSRSFSGHLVRIQVGNEFKLRIAPEGTDQTNSHAYGVRVTSQTTNRGFGPSYIGSLAAFPAHMLRGPWTQTQGDMLTYFMSKTSISVLHMQNDVKHTEHLEAGLLRALETQNRAAITVFYGARPPYRRAHLVVGKNNETLNLWTATPTVHVPQKVVDNKNWKTGKVIFTSGPHSADLISATLPWTPRHHMALDIWINSLRQSRTKEGNDKDEDLFLETLLELKDLVRDEAEDDGDETGDDDDETEDDDD